MKAEDILNKYEQHTLKWLALIENYSETNFKKSPADKEWSITQVCDHMAKVTEECVDNALVCALGKGEKDKSGFGPAFFSWMGSFPPVKLKIKTVPQGMERIYNPQIIFKADAKDRLNVALQKMKDTFPVVQSADLSYRVKHWAGGWFNALQWYHSAEMHIKHHFRQLKRIEKSLIN